MTTIDITNAGGDLVGTFGKLSTPIFAQTFKAPSASDVVLSEWTFQINLAATCTFKLYIYEFNTGTSQVTGSALFASSLFTPSGSVELATFSPSITLDSTKTYVAIALADSSGSSNGKFKLPAGASNSFPDPDTYDYNLYSDGAFFYRNDSTLTGVLASGTDIVGLDGDLAFKAVFSSGASIDNSLFFAE